MGSGICRPRKRWTETVTIVSLLLLAGVAMAACSSGGNSVGAAKAVQSTLARPATGTVILTASDSKKTIQVHVPTKLTLSLPYDPSSGMVWQLESGGAGFSMPRSPVFHDPGSGATLGTEEFSFVMKGKGTLPVVLDYMKPAPITGTPHQFKVTLHGT